MIIDAKAGMILKVPYDYAKYGIIFCLSDSEAIWLYNNYIKSVEGEKTGTCYVGMSFAPKWLIKNFEV